MPAPRLSTFTLFLLILLPIVGLILSATGSFPPALAATFSLPAGPGAVAPAQTAYADPFAYCAALNTIDGPDARYTGPKVPDAIAKALQVADAMPNEPTPPGPADATYVQRSVWRCFNGKVYACYAGANLPCGEKARIDRAPVQAMLDFCRANPANPTIPASVTGLATIFQWRCEKGSPRVIKQFTHADGRGFVAHYWQQITAP